MHNKKQAHCDNCASTRASSYSVMSDFQTIPKFFFSQPVASVNGFLPFLIGKVWC